MIFRDLISLMEQTVVGPISKTKDRRDKENCCLVITLNGFSKVYGRFINEKALSMVQTFLSIFFSAYRKHYNANLVLTNLIENWKKNHDSKKVVGAAFTDSTKASDSIPQDLLITKCF